MRFFLYGTLMTDAGTRMGDWIGERLVAATPARIPGRLIAIETATGWFPALLPGRGGVGVRGTLAELRLGPGELALLDRYEGREYRRVRTVARTDCGQVRTAQVYRWQVAVPPGAPGISDGDFLGWLDRTGNRAFTELRNGV